MNAALPIPVYILCGGKSTRMQREKGLVILEKKTFIQHIIDVVNQFTNQKFLVTGNDDYKIFNLPLLRDIYQNKGPLGGIHTALSHTRSEQVLILSCDIPLIRFQTIQPLINSLKKFPEASIHFAKTKNNWHPLVGIYNKSLLSDLEFAIQNEQLKLIDFIKSQNYKDLEIPDARSLTNINTPQALAQIQTPN